MPYGDWEILENETFEEYGYRTTDLTRGSRKPVKVFCKGCNLKTIYVFKNLKRKHRCAPVVNGKKRCYKCKTWLKLESFSKNRSVFGGYQKACKDCFANYDCVKKGYKKQNRKIKDNIEDYLRAKSNNTKNRIKKKNFAFDIDGEYLLKQYQSQEGKCYYSKTPIFHNKGTYDFDSISIERLDPDKGYVRGNVVLCAYGINSFKGIFTEKEFRGKLREILPALKNYAEE
jgi:hypothetical protein